MEQGRSTLRLGAQKLVPKDLSENLGKLPPQATDLEQVVLGAIMLESQALGRVPYLRHHHFYDERHAIIFQAIQQLAEQQAPHDMRMVAAHLRTLGKLEVVGGHYYLATLTAGVSSSEHIDHHARVIVEQAMKRNLIELSSRISSLAYEDTTDVFDLLHKSEADLQFLKERETASSGPERIKALWEKYRIIEKPVRPETLIKIGDADVCTVGNISQLIGKKKSRKSLLVTYLLHIFLQSRLNLADDLVIFDTEQEEYDVWQAKDRLFRMTNQHIPIFCLRGLSPRDRREFIQNTVKHWHKPLKIIVIDGIRDCMSNINDPDESTEVLTWLMQMNVEFKTHIMVILHQNKTDNNARGHIGTELLNKAEITIEVKLDEKDKTINPPSIVSVESSRRQPFEPFCFTHGLTGLPELLGAPVGEETVNHDEQLRRLESVFEGEFLRNKEVRQSICANFGVGDNKARKLLADFIRRGWVLKSGADRSPNTTYKMNITIEKPTIQAKIDVYQENIFDAPTLNTVNTPSSDDLPF
jgi:hypothetical protein